MQQEEFLTLMQIKSPVLILLCSIFAFLLLGCASGPQSGASSQRSAPSSTPPPGKAGVYLIRTDTVLAAGTIRQWTNVYLDGPIPIDTSRMTIGGHPASFRGPITVNWSNMEEKAAAAASAFPYKNAALSYRQYAYTTVDPGSHIVGTMLAQVNGEFNVGGIVYVSVVSGGVDLVTKKRVKSEITLPGSGVARIGAAANCWKIPRVQMEAGKNYFFRIRAKGGLGYVVEELQEADAQRYIKECKFAGGDNLNLSNMSPFRRGGDGQLGRLN